MSDTAEITDTTDETPDDVEAYLSDTQRTWCPGCVAGRPGHHHAGIVSYHEGGPYTCDCTLRISDEERAAYLAGQGDPLGAVP